MIKEIILYGVEIWGWEDQEELEQIKGKYIEWILKLEREMPLYMYVLDTGEDKLEVKAGARIMRWKRKLMSKEKNLLEKICWKRRINENEKERDLIEKKRRERMKRKVMGKIRWSGKEWNRKVFNCLEEDVKGEVKNGLEIMATFRMGSETNACKYWKEDREKICRMC